MCGGGLTRDESEFWVEGGGIEDSDKLVKSVGIDKKESECSVRGGGDRLH